MSSSSHLYDLLAISPTMFALYIQTLNYDFGVEVFRSAKAGTPGMKIMETWVDLQLGLM